ncbi:hypothetical protein ICL81_01025 [Leucobacter sp. cx-328]|uniref:DUF6264 family protein n=1 Tax=unclassified Leucobacter TaxID=2621730 RepID=UPI00165E24BE|nr:MULTISPECIES: DUF6264 family protein [unclassified Leucobacter]MBC9943113.1 hypothetical protein [Leucobacter sp. cx-328]
MTDDSTTPVTPEQGADQAKPAQPAAARPKPEFGEYAPEGWQWTPPGEENAEAAPAGSVDTATSAAGPLPGIPHNLGSGSNAGAGAGAPIPAAAPQQPAAQAPQAQQAPGAPYRASAPQQPGQPAGAPQPIYQTQTPKKGGADKVFTIILLVLGAMGALFTAQSMLVLRSSFAMIAEALEVSSSAVPASIGTLGTVSALVVLAIYALTLIFSIRRLRAKKVTFWVPLVAGVVVSIGFFIATTIAVSSMPELMTALSDPDAVQKMLDYMATTTQP